MRRCLLEECTCAIRFLEEKAEHAMLKIEFSPDVEDRLRDEARRRGVNVAEYVRRVVEREVRLPRERAARSGRPDVAGNDRDWLRDFDRWIAGHTRTTPLLTDEDLRRERLYGERGL